MFEPKSINSGSVLTSEHLHFVYTGSHFRIIVLLQVFPYYFCPVAVVVVGVMVVV